jgi:hypothetical protein
MAITSLAMSRVFISSQKLLGLSFYDEFAFSQFVNKECFRGCVLASFDIIQFFLSLLLSAMDDMRHGS